MLHKDLSMLRELNIMDYSLLLIIIHYPDIDDSEYQNIMNAMKENRFANRIFVSQKKKYIYSLGLIDYLQKFDFNKFLENKYKRFLFGNEINNVSAVNPLIYASRMLNFSQKSIFI